MPEPTPDLHSADTCFYEERRIRPAFPHIHGAHLAECAPALSAGRAGAAPPADAPRPGRASGAAPECPAPAATCRATPAAMGGRTGPRATLGSAAGRVNGRAALGVVEVGARQRAAQRPESGRDGQDHLVRPPHTGSARKAEQGPRGGAGRDPWDEAEEGGVRPRTGRAGPEGRPNRPRSAGPECVNAPCAPCGSPSSTRGTGGARRRDAHRDGQRGPRPPGDVATPRRAPDPAPPRTARAPHGAPAPAQRNGPRRRPDTRVSAPAGGTRYGNGRPGPRRPPSRRLAPTRSRSAG